MNMWTVLMYLYSILWHPVYMCTLPEIVNMTIPIFRIMSWNICSYNITIGNSSCTLLKLMFHCINQMLHTTVLNKIIQWTISYKLLNNWLQMTCIYELIYWNKMKIIAAVTEFRVIAWTDLSYIAVELID